MNHPNEVLKILDKELVNRWSLSLYLSGVRHEGKWFQNSNQKTSLKWKLHLLVPKDQPIQMLKSQRISLPHKRYVIMYIIM